jgi:hypothetical protein
MNENSSYEMTNLPCLYGLEHSNRVGDDLWGKNQFNSTFPTALACWMRDNGVRPVYLSVDSQLQVFASEISFDDVFNSALPTGALRFDFESKFLPYQQYVDGDIGGIDLVVKRHNAPVDQRPTWCRPLEVKLTVLPDSTTYELPEAQWGSELVVRPASTKYCALGIRDDLSAQDLTELREVFEPACRKVRYWDSETEVLAHSAHIVEACNAFQAQFFKRQKPFLMQPVWKTQGRSPALHENAFDIFIWSDFALCRTFLDRASDPSARSVDRFLRSSLRFARVLYELSNRGIPRIDDIYTQMTYGLQTDKEFALSGRATRSYMECDRLNRPSLGREVVLDIIRNGGEKMLSPERRFDATVYFTADSLFRR